MTPVRTCSITSRSCGRIWQAQRRSSPGYAITIPTNDSNRARWPIDPTWKAVQHAFDDLSEEGAGELIRLKKQEVSIERTTAAVASYLTTLATHYCVKKGYTPNEMDLSVFVNEVAKDVETVFEHKETDFQEQIALKQERYYYRKAVTDQAYARHEVSFFDREETIEGE